MRPRLAIGTSDDTLTARLVALLTSHSTARIHQARCAVICPACHTIPRRKYVLNGLTSDFRSQSVHLRSIISAACCDPFPRALCAVAAVFHRIRSTRRCATCPRANACVTRPGSVFALGPRTAPNAARVCVAVGERTSTCRSTHALVTCAARAHGCHHAHVHSDPQPSRARRSSSSRMRSVAPPCMHACIASPRSIDSTFSIESVRESCASAN